MLNVNTIAHDSVIYGPGKRDVVWFQGCRFHCKNCINPHMWSFENKHLFTPEELFHTLKSKEITLLGGEPLQQPDILSFIQILKSHNCGIVLFTGYELTELSGDKLKAVELCDVAITGRFVEKLQDDSLYLRGSSNQKIIFNSNRYKKEDFDLMNSYEIIIADDVESRGRSRNFVNELFDL